MRTISSWETTQDSYSIALPIWHHPFRTPTRNLVASWLQWTFSILELTVDHLGWQHLIPLCGIPYNIILNITELFPVEESGCGWNMIMRENGSITYYCIQKVLACRTIKWTFKGAANCLEMIILRVWGIIFQDSEYTPNQW